MTEKTQKVPQRWQLADDTKDYQDEYLKWSVARDESDNVIIATFTCEGPEVRLPLHSNPLIIIDCPVLEIHGQLPAKYHLGPLSILESRFRRSDAGIRSLLSQPCSHSQACGVKSNEPVERLDKNWLYCPSCSAKQYAIR